MGDDWVNEMSAYGLCVSFVHGHAKLSCVTYIYYILFTIASIRLICLYVFMFLQVLFLGLNNMTFQYVSFALSANVCRCHLYFNHCTGSSVCQDKEREKRSGQCCYLHHVAHGSLVLWLLSRDSRATVMCFLRCPRSSNVPHRYLLWKHSKNRTFI